MLFVTIRAANSHAQDTRDTIPDILSDSTIYSIANETIAQAEQEKSTFKPNPKTAYICAAIFPGFGQIYNRQYWKLPIVYGGLMGCVYAITWNNKNYNDYKDAYFGIMTDLMNDPQGENPESWSKSWQDFIPSGSDPATYLKNTSFQNQLKSGKDFYRRYRDLSVIVTLAVYLIFVADAYVDAQMFDFDISPDLSFHVAPDIRPSSVCSSRSYGFNVCLTF